MATHLDEYIPYPNWIMDHENSLAYFFFFFFSLSLSLSLFFFFFFFLLLFFFSPSFLLPFFPFLIFFSTDTLLVVCQLEMRNLNCFFLVVCFVLFHHLIHERALSVYTRQRAFDVMRGMAFTYTHSIFTDGMLLRSYIIMNFHNAS
ncbi:hypothetical protein V8C37DRAFT_272189 [Trichoderma ceciliae]